MTSLKLVKKSVVPVILVWFFFAGAGKGQSNVAVNPAGGPAAAPATVVVENAIGKDNDKTTPAERKANLVITLGDGVTMEFVLVQPGSFIMGSDRSRFPDEKPAHRVTITKPFYLGKFEVTQAQWEAVMSNTPGIYKGPLYPDSAKRPVENVSWDYCQVFLARLNEKINIYKFRLPTEAEWEYACRAGSTDEYSFGTNADAVGDYAWYSNNSSGQTHPVGGKKPNAWGLYDMYGNVWEWCSDGYGPYPARDISDPTGTNSNTRVIRGGAWNSVAEHVSSSYRENLTPDDCFRYYGLRCVAVSKPVR